MLGTCLTTDELLKLRGYNAIIMPYIAKMIIPASPLTKLYDERSIYIDYLKYINNQSKIYNEELSIIEILKENKYITEDEAIKWIDKVENNKFIINERKKDTFKLMYENLDEVNAQTSVNHNKFLNNIEQKRIEDLKRIAGSPK